MKMSKKNISDLNRRLRIAVAVTVFILAAAFSTLAFAEDTYIVKLSDGYVSLFSETDGVSSGLESLGYSTASSLDEAEMLVSMGIAESYEPDYEVFLFDESYEPTDSMYAQQYAPAQIGANRVWQLGMYGEGVKVCIIDSGCSSHIDLGDSIVYRKNLLYANGIGDSEEDITDDHGHGTHVAGILAARLNGVGVVGVAPKCSIGIIRCFTSNTSVVTKASHIVAAVVAAIDEMDADVISMSLGMTGLSSALKAAVARAIANDIIVVAAVGNYSSTNNYSDAIMYPAGYDGVIGVASVDSTCTRASSSVKNITVDVCAGGVSVYSLNTSGGYVKKGGTSMATPAVSGAAALIRAYNRSLTGKQISDLIINTATPVGTAQGERTDEYGYGLVNVEKAVKSLIPKGIYFSQSNIFNFNGTDKMYYSVFNNSDAEDNAALVHAEYDSTSSKMTAVSCLDFAPGSVKNFSQLCEGKPDVKIMVFNSMQRLVPICDVKTK